MTSDNWFIDDQNAVYFLIFTIVDWVDVFTRKEYKFVITDSLNYCIDLPDLTGFKNLSGLNLRTEPIFGNYLKV